MSTNRHIDKICCAVLAFVLILTLVFANAEKFGITAAEVSMGYETKLFDPSAVHTIEIVMDDWEDFLDTCEDEEYAVCSVIIDNEAYKNVGIRAKGNTSLSSVAAYGNDRYSFKIEFDHYDNTKNYYGLDKVSLNNIIQDNTYMKDYLTYQMMRTFGVSSPLCSYVNITVNGEEWGLYLAVEGVEDSFLERNYGTDYGELYKPDSMGMGGGHGNGRNFDRDDFDPDDTKTAEHSADNNTKTGGKAAEEGEGVQQSKAPPESDTESESAGMPENDRKPGLGGGEIGSDDVSLIYSDEDYNSYSNIFDNAKTSITDTDKDRLIASLKQLNENENIEDIVNIEEVIRYFVVHNFVCNFDSYTGSMIHNYYLYEEDGMLSMIPWDYNLAFGGFLSVSDATALVNYPIDSPVSGGTIASRPMLAWIFGSEEYEELYHQYFAEFLQECFSSSYVEDLINQTVELISPYVEKDPTKFCTYEEFETGVSVLKEFCLLRAESIQGQLDGSIPSTNEDQTADDTALINASDISISAMGSMGNTIGQPDVPENSDGMPQMTDHAEGFSGKEGGAEENRFSPAGGQMQAAQSTMDGNDWILIGISVAILSAGLCFALGFKRCGKRPSQKNS